MRNFSTEFAFNEGRLDITIGNGDVLPSRLRSHSAIGMKQNKRKTPTETASPLRPAKRVGLHDGDLWVPAEFTNAQVAARARAVTATVLDEAATDALFAGASVQFLNEDESSWIYHIPHWYTRIHGAVDDAGDYETWFEQAWDLHPQDHATIMMFGRPVLTPRFQQAYGESYRFSGNTFEAKPFPDAMQRAVQLLQGIVAHANGAVSYLNSGLVNWYADGDHYMGPHADDERTIYKQSPILTLSLGAARRFIFTPKKSPTGSNGSRLELLLNDGDLLVMGGRTQQTHKHALPKMKRCQDKRISITMRCFLPKNKSE